MRKTNIPKPVKSLWYIKSYNETFQQCGKQDSFRRILKRPIDRSYDRLSTKLFTNITAIRPGLIALENSRNQDHLSFD